ncbi:MAG: hypothetical protein KME17_10610 [Cyanosarcina radialis HA8281-LM2]|nr:hypothetical protein [Cyanosarcina radialis HA8281-LM2]
MISGNELLYTDMIEPIGDKAKENNEQFEQEYSKVINKFTLEFMQKFCDREGQIVWSRIVQLNSTKKI